MHLHPQPCGSALETEVSSCGRRGKWDTQRGEEHGRVAATEEPRARGCGTGCPFSLSSSGVAEGKGASAVPLSPRTLGDCSAAPALPERTALQPSPLAWSLVQSRSRQSLAGVCPQSLFLTRLFCDLEGEKVSREAVQTISF